MLSSDAFETLRESRRAELLMSGVVVVDDGRPWCWDVRAFRLRRGSATFRHAFASSMARVCLQDYIKFYDSEFVVGQTKRPCIVSLSFRRFILVSVSVSMSLSLHSHELASSEHRSRWKAISIAWEVVYCIIRFVYIITAEISSAYVHVRSSTVYFLSLVACVCVWLQVKMTLCALYCRWWWWGF